MRRARLERGSTVMVSALIAAATTTVAGMPALASAAPAACVPRLAVSVRTLAADGKTLSYCYPTEDRTNDLLCSVVDLATGVWAAPTRKPEPPEPPGPDEPSRYNDDGVEQRLPGDLVVTAQHLERCDAAGACQRWPRPRGLSPGIWNDLLLDEASGALIMTETPGESRLRLTRWVLATGKRAAQRVHRIGQDELLGIIDVRLLDDAIVVTTSVCAGPCETGTIFAASTLKRRAEVGGGLATDRFAPIRLGPSLWAFHDSTGDRVVFQNVHTGKIKRTIRLGAQLDFTTDLERRPQGDLIVHGDDGFVVLIDPATGKVTRRVGTLCEVP